MATLNVTLDVQRFTVGGTVNVYPQSNFSGPNVDSPSGAPPGSATTSATVGTAGATSFTGLADGTSYYGVYNPSGSDYRYVHLQTPPAAAGGGLTQPLALNQPPKITDQSTTPADHEFTISPRIDSNLTFPVPVFRPTKTTTVAALDITPNGAPSDNSGNGKAWVDVCDTDIRDVVGGNVATTRIAAFSDHGEVSTRRFGSATTRPLHIAADYDGVSAPAIKLVPGAPNVLNLGLDGGLTAVGNVSGSSQVPFLLTQNANTAAAGVVRGRTGASSTQDVLLFQDGTPTTVLSVTYAGQLKTVAANMQTTVGAAGSASAMPTPREYMKVQTPSGLGIIPVCNP